MIDISKIRIWVPDQKALNDVLSAARVEMECGAPKRDPDGHFVVTLYATKAEALKVAALGYRHEIDDHYGDVLEEVHKAISKTDRFQGGKVKPQGLGVKR